MPADKCGFALYEYLRQNQKFMIDEVFEIVTSQRFVMIEFALFVIRRSPYIPLVIRRNNACIGFASKFG